MRYLPLLFLVFVGCLTPKKADKRLDQIMEEYPEKVAVVCKDEFPCKPVKSDTVEKVYYDLIEVECPDVKPVIITSHDTIIKDVVKTVKVKVPGKETIITKYFEDSAKIKLLTADLEKCKANVVVVEKKTASKINWLLLLIIGALIYFLSRKK